MLNKDQPLDMLQTKPHFHDVIGLERGITIKYYIKSPLGPIDNYRYKQSILGRIMLNDDQGNDLEEIGRIYIDKLLFNTGLQNGWGHFEVYDTEQYTMNLGSAIWDFEKQDFVEPLLKFFTYDLIESNVLYMHTIEVLPEYRGMQIGEHAMKDAANNFEHGCSLIVTDCVPIQQVCWGHKDKDWHKKMKYSQFEKGKKKAKEKLINYLKRTGFYYIPKVSKDHMFMCTAHKNPNFDYIELE